jgi:hypothetical protein
MIHPTGPSEQLQPPGLQRIIAPGDSHTVGWLTRHNCKWIGVVVPYPQAFERILDTLPLVEGDHRVQVVFVVPETGYQWAGMEEAVRAVGGLCLPWHQACEIQFDLILAACDSGIRDLTGPVVLMPHGVGLFSSRIDPWADEAPHLLQSGNLMREEEVLPAALCLAHEGELATLAEYCPQAVDRALVTGDLSFDRMLASWPFRNTYRDSLEVREHQKLVVVSTTWGSHSLFGTDPAIFARVKAELPPDHYRVLAVIHPFVWLAHGRRQVLAWLSGARAAGVEIVEPRTWRGAAVSADLVIGDHGSTTMYPAGLGVPVLMNKTASLADIRPGSTADMLARWVESLNLDLPLLPQVERAMDRHDLQRRETIAGLITSRPGQSGTIMRRLL